MLMRSSLSIPNFRLLIFAVEVFDDVRTMSLAEIGADRVMGWWASDVAWIEEAMG
jgi:hypothetical protein